jgi:hypothetical protein
MHRGNQSQTAQSAATQCVIRALFLTRFTIPGCNAAENRRPGDPGRRPTHQVPPATGSKTSAAASGNSIQKVVPCPTSDSKPICPPIRSTN